MTLLIINGGQGEGDALGRKPEKAADPFVHQLILIMADRRLKPKDLSMIYDKLPAIKKGDLPHELNPQTIRKLLRAGMGSNRLRQMIALALGFESFAEIHELGRQPRKENESPAQPLRGMEDDSVMDEIKTLRERIAVLEWQMKQIWEPSARPPMGLSGKTITTKK